MRHDDGDAYAAYIGETGSLDDIRAFAGDDVNTAVYYPEDERYLVERDLTVAHYEVAAQ